MQLRILAVFCAALTLAGCKTDYQASEGGLGYTDRQIGPDMYQIQVRVTEATGQDTAQHYLIQRASELCGFKTPVITEMSQQDFNALAKPAVALLYMPKHYHVQPMVTGTVHCQ